MILLHGRKHPAMITDANGVVLLSNRPHLIFQTLWPVSPEVLSLISSQYTTAAGAGHFLQTSG